MLLGDILSRVNCCWDGCTVEGGVYCYWLLKGLINLAVGRSTVAGWGILLLM